MKATLQLALDALRLPVNRWNKAQSMQVNAAIAACDIALEILITKRKALRKDQLNELHTPQPERVALTQTQLTELHTRLGGVPKQPTYNEKKVKV